MTNKLQCTEPFSEKSKVTQNIRPSWGQNVVVLH